MVLGGKDSIELVDGMSVGSCPSITIEHTQTTILTMKFARHLCFFQTPLWEQEYVDYNLIKWQLKYRLAEQEDGQSGEAIAQIFTFHHLTSTVHSHLGDVAIQ
jgi:hypothetical protein